MIHPCKHSPNVTSPGVNQVNLIKYKSINKINYSFKPDQMQSPKHQNYDRSNRMLLLFYHSLHFW